MAKKNYSKSKIVITEKYRKKYGVCEHDQVSYKALDKMCRSLLLHCKRLSRDIDRKGKWMELWMKKQKERMTLEDQLTEDKAHLFFLPILSYCSQTVPSSYLFCLCLLIVSCSVAISLYTSCLKLCMKPGRVHTRHIFFCLCL